MWHQEKFRSIEPKYKEVTRQEFENFIKNYPRKLIQHFVQTYGYLDLTLSTNKSNCLVATTANKKYDISDERNIYFIMINYEDIYTGKIEII